MRDSEGDANTGRQIGDQKQEEGNLDLEENYMHGRPVRVMAHLTVLTGKGTGFLPKVVVHFAVAPAVRTCPVAALAVTVAVPAPGRVPAAMVLTDSPRPPIWGMV